MRLTAALVILIGGVTPLLTQRAAPAVVEAEGLDAGTDPLRSTRRVNLVPA